MKIDRRRPSHWLILAIAGCVAVCARMLRALGVRPCAPPLVLLYGHKLNGNLLALYRYLKAHPAPPFRVVVLTLDPAYHRTLRAEGIDCALAIVPSSIALLTRASAIVTDHGLHSLQLMVGARGLRLFDVWHGIPFKGFDGDDFRLQHRYDEVWVSSPAIRQLYVERFGFDPQRVVATGYGRTDVLIHRDAEAEQRMRSALGLRDGDRCVLFAPTWRQDDAKRDIYPFGQHEEVFLGALAAVCERHNAVLLVRKHLNSGGAADAGHASVRMVPSADFPDAESILAISDVLILDWSSIAFDFLVLDRPAIFLDVPPPFAKGFSLGPQYRFGDVVPDMATLLETVDWRLGSPAAYGEARRAEHNRVRAEVYGELADGKASARYVDRLSRHLLSGGSSR